MKNAWNSENVFVACCGFLYATLTLLMTPFGSLLEPDSNGYLTFDPTRTALYPAFLYICKLLGLDLVEITWVQTFVFALALSYLLRVLLRAEFPRWLLIVFVSTLIGNILFSSFHRSILTESLFFSLGAFATGLWIEYFRTGRLGFLAWSGLVVGLMIGFRPVGLAIVPLQILAVLLGRSSSLSKLSLLLIALMPVALGVGAERLVYRLAHDGSAKSTASLLFMGKAALLIKPGMAFSGPNKNALLAVAPRLAEVSLPMQQILNDSPSLLVRIVLAAPYEGQAQSSGFLSKELSEAARVGNTTVEALRTDLGTQVILQNLSGYLRQVLLTEIGQWSVSAQRFPPTARMMTAYAVSNPAVDLGGGIAPEVLHPAPSLFAYIIYPTFLIAGGVTFLLAFCILPIIARPRLMESAEGFYLGIAAFLSTLCQGYTLFISLSNVWTSRFLMAIVPQIEIVALCLLLLILHRCKLVELRRPA